VQPILLNRMAVHRITLRRRRITVKTKPPHHTAGIFFNDSAQPIRHGDPPCSCVHLECLLETAKTFETTLLTGTESTPIRASPKTSVATSITSNTPYKTSSSSFDRPFTAIQQLKRPCFDLITTRKRLAAISPPSHKNVLPSYRYQAIQP